MGRRVDRPNTAGLSFQALLKRKSTVLEPPNGKADIQPPQPQAEEQARIPGQDGNAVGARDSASQAQAGPQAPRRNGRHQVTPGRVDAEPGGDDGRKLPRARRLSRGSEIRAMFERGKRSRTAHLDVFDSPSPVARSRVGVVVPRYGHHIVERNLLKRRLREILRKQVLPGLRSRGDGHDVLVRSRREAYAAGYNELQLELEEWLNKRWPLVSS